MAQTRKKRKRRHRGTQAGTIEARGRTGRPGGTSASARKPAGRAEARDTARQRRAERFDQPPTWRGALNRALIAAAIFAVAAALLQRSVAAGVVLAVAMVVLYLPMSYYTDLFLYRRRQRQKRAGKG